MLISLHALKKKAVGSEGYKKNIFLFSFLQDNHD